MAVPDKILAAHEKLMALAMNPRTQSSREFHDARDEMLCLVGKLIIDHRDEINRLLAKEAAR